VAADVPGLAAPAKETVPLQWKSADLLEAAIAIGGRETLLNTVEIAGQPPVTLPPVCLPYSPEFAPAQPNRGATALARIAATTGGQERIEISKIWSGLPLKSRYVELAPWLREVAEANRCRVVWSRQLGFAPVIGFDAQPAAARHEARMALATRLIRTSPTG